jgi:HEAT repeat protein
LDSDPDVRVDAAEALGHLKAETAVEPLLANIEGDPEGDVRIAAVKALAKIGATTAVDRLIRCIRQSGYPELDQMVDDADFGACWEVQGGALKALGGIGDASAAQPLIELLGDDENEDLQESGYQVLAKLDDDRAEQFLIEQLNNGEPLTRRRAAQALSAMLAARNALPEDLLGALNGALVDSDPSVRMYAARALSSNRNPTVATPLTRLLNDPEAEVRHEVASLLGSSRGPAIAGRLHDLLQQAEPRLKHQLVRILGEIADTTSYSPLYEVLQNCDPTKDRHLLYETIVALGAIGETGPEQELAEILANTELHHTLRVQAARALGRICPEAMTDRDANQEQPKTIVREALVDAVDDENPGVGYAAITSLINIDREQAVDKLLAVLRADTPAADSPEPESESRRPATDVNDISEGMRDMIGDHDPGTSTLAAILAPRSAAAESPEPEPKSRRRAETRSEKRALAARLLGNIPEPGSQVMTGLIEVGADADAAVRKEAILALGRLADPNSVPVILNGLNANDDDVRLASLDALSNFSHMKKVSERLAVLFDDPNPYIRERIVTTLNGNAGPEAAVCLLRALEDADPKVCRAALARLPAVAGKERAAQLASELIIKFAGELRVNAAAALRKMNDHSSCARLLGMLNDDNQQELHWICIDALAEMFAPDPIAAEYPI